MEYLLLISLLMLGAVSWALYDNQKLNREILREFSQELTTLQLRLRDLERRKYPYGSEKEIVKDIKKLAENARKQ